MHTIHCNRNCAGRITDFHVGQFVLYLPIADANASTRYVEFEDPFSEDDPFSERHHYLHQGYIIGIEEEDILVEFSFQVENPFYRVPSDYEEGEEFDPWQEPVYQREFTLRLKPCQIEPEPERLVGQAATWNPNQPYDENGKPLPPGTNRYLDWDSKKPFLSGDAKPPVDNGH